MISAFSFLQGGIDLNVFEAVKQSVTTRQAAEHYGIRVNRNGMACCPFHNDKTPSMKLDRRYHCFGCGADGDVIDFAAALYGLGKKEAAVQLAQDFGLSYEDWKPPGKAKKPKPRQKSPEEQFQEAKNRCFRTLADYLHLLMAWRMDYAPHSPEEAFHPRFVEALQKQAHVEYLLDVLLFGETEEKAALITDYRKDWLIQFSTKYHLSYMGTVSELLKQLDSLHSYDLLNQYAMKSLTIAPDNPKAYCWLIRSLKAQGMNELATNELAAAKEHLTTEEYEEILAFGANWQE